MIRTAIIHDWLTGMRGGESVLEAILDLFPQADLFTLVYDPKKVSAKIQSFPIQTSWLQRVPGALQRYRHFLPLMPRAIESFDLTSYDFILSSSHCVAKGVRKAKEALHVSYVHAPMRYIWDRFDDYFAPGKASWPVRTAAQLVRQPLQNWDYAASQSPRVDHLIANSGFIAEQIEQAYGRSSQVIYPFARLERFLQSQRIWGDSYLMVTAFAPYKRVDLAIDAFNQLKLPLQIVGSGQDEKRLKSRAGPTIEFLGSVDDGRVTELYRSCRALIFPGVEDFGITPLEAMASGAPVIAYGHGGVKETVTAETGIFFPSPSIESLIEAVEKLEKNSRRFDPEACRKRASLFSEARFKEELTSFLTQKLGKNLSL
ncbi:MAG: glycosyltransferase [Bdellovibrionia bacterium]